MKPRLTAKDRVEIGLNVIAMHDIDDAHHTVQCNILMQVRWCPDRKYEKKDGKDNGEPPECTPWYPWIQLHNLHSMVHFVGTDENRGLPRQSPDDLRKVILQHRKTKPNETLRVLELSNFVAKFINPLQLRKFPYDTQFLTITIISGKTSEMTLTHKVDRDDKHIVLKKTDGEIAWLPPKRQNMSASSLIDNGTEVRTIKCNLEGDTVSEWTIKLRETANETVARDGEHFPDGEDGSSKSAPAIFVYRFGKHDASNSAEGNVYQRLDCYALAQREVMNIMMTVIAPTAGLCFGSLSAFAMDVETDIGDRLSILFTIILAIIANSIATQGRLPKVNYLTWADICLNTMQSLVYLVVVQTAACKKVAELTNLTTSELDSYCMYVFVGIFIFAYLFMIIYSLYLDLERAHLVQRSRRDDDASFWKEEARLVKIETDLDFTHEEIKRRSNGGNADRFHDVEVEVSSRQE